MALDILDSLKSAFGSPVTRQISAIFGDSEDSTRSGLRSSFSALLAGVLNKSRTPGGAEDVYRTVTSDNVEATLPSRITGLLDNRGSLDASLATGESMLGSIFGNRTSGVTQAISEVSGLKLSSATGLLAMAAPMLMGVLKKHVAQNNLDARGLGSVLLGQRTALQSAGLDSRITSAMGIPNLQSLFGVSAASGMGAAPEEPRSLGAASTGYARDEHVPPPGGYGRRETTRRRWIPWAIAAAIAVAALALLSPRTGNRERARVAATNSTQTATPVAQSLPVSVYFDTGRADLNSHGERTILQVATTVKKSSMPVAVTGYADASGDPGQNAELAKNRASAVRDELVRDGVEPSHVVMAAPASVTPGAPADQARRVEIRVAEVSETTGVGR